MLILTKHIHDAMDIGEDVHVKVLGIQGNQVRLGIDAPKTIAVNRKEIHLKIQAEKESFKKALPLCSEKPSIDLTLSKHQQTH